MKVCLWGGILAFILDLVNDIFIIFELEFGYLRGHKYRTYRSGFFVPCNRIPTLNFGVGLAIVSA